jgi:glycosyltransferase involved in cell wall biosynthesis
MDTPLISLFTSGNQGGIIRTNIRLANAFSALGYRVHLLLEKKGFPFEKELKQGVEIKRLFTLNRITGVPFLVRYLQRYTPSVILTPVFQHTELAVRTRELMNFPGKIFAVIRVPYQAAWEQIPPAKRAFRINRINRYYPKTDGILANSNGVAADFCELTGMERSRITTVYNPAYDDNIKVLMDQPIDHPWFGPDEPPVILSVGRLERAKNIGMLLTSFEKVRARVNCRLVLIGDGSMRSDLETSAESSRYRKDIAFLGYQLNPIPYMRHASIFSISSSWEGFGNVIVEALATGTPVVATDCPGGPAEILGYGRHGRLVPVDDSDAMAHAMEDLILSPPPRESIIKEAERFSATLIAEQYINIFSLDHPRAGRISGM